MYSDIIVLVLLVWFASIFYTFRWIGWILILTECHQSFNSLRENEEREREREEDVNMLQTRQAGSPYSFPYQPVPFSHN